MSNHRKIVILGATSAMAQACARLWLSEMPTDIALVGRSSARLERVADDLRVRSPNSSIQAIETDLTSPEAVSELAASLAEQGAIDIVLVAHGSLPDQADCQSSLQVAADALSVNAASPAICAEAFARHLTVADRGTLIVIGSVAGDRGRKSNYVYGAAKGLVTRYVQGLQHRFYGTGVNVVLVKPGPTDTPMTSHLKQSGAKLASVDTVAQQIVKGAASGKRVIYSPGKWWLIMMIIRHLPFFIFGKMDI